MRASIRFARHASSGHARPSITLDIYAHEFEHDRGLDDVRNSIDVAFGPSRI